MKQTCLDQFTGPCLDIKSVFSSFTRLAWRCDTVKPLLIGLVRHCSHPLPHAEPQGALKGWRDQVKDTHKDLPRGTGPAWAQAAGCEQGEARACHTACPHAGSCQTLRA